MKFATTAANIVAALTIVAGTAQAGGSYATFDMIPGRGPGQGIAGKPGDRLFAYNQNPYSPWWFADPVNLAGVTNGISVAVFPSADYSLDPGQAYDWVSFTIGPPGGFTMVSAPISERVTVNGVKGGIARVSQAELQRVLDRCATCASFGDLWWTEIYVYDTAPPGSEVPYTEVQWLDAASVAVGSDPTVYDSSRLPCSTKNVSVTGTATTQNLFTATARVSAGSDCTLNRTFTRYDFGPLAEYP